MAQPSNKRKRAPEDVGRQLEEPQVTTTTTDEDFSTSLLQHVEADNQRTTAEAALAQHMPPYPDPSYGSDAAVAGGSMPPFPDAEPNQDNQSLPAPTTFSRAGSKSKPSMGTDEWHAIRKASHKEVERRRREVINEGIENISKIIPSVDGNNNAADGKNKGAILHRAHAHILKLNELEAKFEDERRVLNQAVEELTKRNDSLQRSHRQAWSESNKWQERCRALNGQFDDYDSHGPSFDDANDLDALQS